MIVAVDTNVVVRFLVRDDLGQYKRAVELFRNEIIHMPETVWMETEWVLRYAYKFDRVAISNAFRSLLGLPQVRVADADRLMMAIDWHAAGLDFADALHLAHSQDMEALATFDQAFVSKSAGRGRCPVREVPPVPSPS